MDPLCEWVGAGPTWCPGTQGSENAKFPRGTMRVRAMNMMFAEPYLTMRIMRTL